MVLYFGKEAVCMGRLISLSIITIIFFMAGKYLSAQNQPLFGKIFHNRYGERTLNNYIGNMVATTGLVLFAAFAMGIGNMLFFLFLAVMVFLVFCVHAAEAYEVPVSCVIEEQIWNKKVKKLKMYPVTIKLIASILVTGIIASSLYSIIPIQEPEEKTQGKNETFIEELIKELDAKGGISLEDKETVIRVQ